MDTSGQEGGRHMYLGIDIGTSSVKAVLVDDTQSVIAIATAELDVTRPQAGWSEQDPDDWINATETAIDGLRAQVDLSGVTGIGLSGHMHGATLLGSDDKPLRPCILWNDGRASAEAAELDGQEQFRALTGNIVFPGFTAPKLLWVQHHEAAVFSNTARVLLPKDYVRLWLSGEAVSDMSDAAGTSWLDVAARAWSPDLLAATNLDVGHMPRLVEGTDVSGRLKRQLASRWGIKGAPVIAGGGGDNAASAAGVGVVAPGTAFLSLGTSGVLFVSNDKFRPNAKSAVHAFCHAVPDTWHQMGVILSAAAALDWLSGITGKSAGELTNKLGADLRRPSPVTFLPYLAGERTPHNDVDLRGSFTDIGLATSTEDLTQSVLEGVAYAFADCRDALAQAGTSLGAALAVGGGTRSDYWLKTIATVLNIPIHLPISGDFGAAFGAARLGMIAATSADPLSVLTQPQISASVEPVSEMTTAFVDAGRHRSALTTAIRDAR